MKKTAAPIAFALAALAFAAGEATAQERMVGVKAGYVSANVDEDGVDSRGALGFGAFYRAPLGTSVSVQPELLYMPKGFSMSEDGVDGTWKLNYLQLPVLFQYHFSTNGNLAPRIFAGPAFALEVGCEIEGEESGTSASIDCDEFSDFGLDLGAKSFEFGLVLGAGVDFAAGSMVVTLDGRYDMGLSDALEFEDVSGLKNRAWAFFGGVGFPVGP